MQLFMKDEKLEGDEMWYCGKCKEHVVAQKKMSIYSCPEILVVHLKRFSHTRGLFGGRKINDLVSFPVEGLDLTRYVIDQSDNTKVYKYDLYAVSNHYGF